MLVFSGSIAVASDISAAIYYGNIQVTNNGTNATNESTLITGINTTNLINSGFINASANNCAIQYQGNDVAFQPAYYPDSDWFMLVSAINSNEIRNYTFYTNSTGGKIAYFPSDSGMSVSDNSTLEMGSDNGSISMTAFVDTTANGTDSILFEKPNAIKCFRSGNVTGNITARIYDSSNETMTTPANHTDYSTEWDNESYAYDDDNATYADRDNIPVNSWSGYLGFHLSEATPCNSISYIAKYDGATGIDEIDVDLYYDSAWHDIYQGAFSDNTTETKDIGSIENVLSMRIRLYNESDGSATKGQIYEVDFGVAGTIELTATGLTSDEYNIRVTSDNHSVSGNTSLCATATSGMFGMLYTSPSNSCNLSSIWVYAEVDLPMLTPDIKGGIYDSSFNLIAETDIIACSPASSEWVELPFTGGNITTISPNTDIWIVVWCEDDKVEVFRTSFARPSNTSFSGFGSFPTFPDPISPSGFASHSYSFYLTYTPLWSLIIDGTEYDYAEHHTSLENNTKNWQFGSLATPYIVSANVTINGTAAGSWQWEYGSTFSDLTGNDNTATPDFRSSSSNANVTANMTTFMPISESDAPAYTVEDAEDFITSTPTITGAFRTGVDTTTPGIDVIEDIANAGNTPPQLPMMILSMVGLLTLSFIITASTRKFGSNSTIPKLIIVAAAIGCLIALSIADFWMLIYFLMLGCAAAMAKTHYSWGGESHYNLIGALAMAFVGLTIINRIMEGAFIASADVAILNDVMVFQPVNVANAFSISVPNLDFLTSGIPALMRWDYSFFGGNAVLIQYLLYTITAMVTFILFVLMLGAVFNILSRLRG